MFRMIYGPYLKDLGSVPYCLMDDRMIESFAPVRKAVAASGVRSGVFLAVGVSALMPPLT